jgi:hypothetical protein
MLKLKLDSLDWALNLALKYRDTDIFPSVFELEAIQHNNSLISKLADENILDWSVRGLRKCLTPKHRYGFRVATQLDPLDFLIYTALVYEIGSDLEKRRIPINEGIVHSYRFSPNADGQIDDSNISHLEFHRMWLLSIFSQNAGFNQEQEFATLHSKYTDSFSSRELILALGSSHQDYWFSSRKQKVFEFEPWQRRAVLFAGSCMGVDERKHWYDFLEPRLDPLELAVTKFARANPI